MNEFCCSSTMISLFPWNEKLLVVTCTCVKTYFYHYPWEPRSKLRPHSMLSTQHFDSPRNVAWCLLRQRTAERRVKTLRHAANQEVQFVNVISWEEASNTDPQLTVHHLNPLNKRLCRRQIHPLRIYSIFDKKNDVVSTRREDSRPRESGTAGDWGWGQSVPGIRTATSTPHFV